MLNPDNFAHYPKNPVIGAFFREIDRADELGSGMRKMMMYGKKYGGADPQLIEGDVFRMIISVPEFGEKPSNTLGRESATVSSGPESGPESIFERVIRELLISSRSKSELDAALGHRSVSGKLNERIPVQHELAELPVGLSTCMYCQLSGYLCCFFYEMLAAQPIRACTSLAPAQEDQGCHLC